MAKAMKKTENEEKKVKNKKIKINEAMFHRAWDRAFERAQIHNSTWAFKQIVIDELFNEERNG